MRFYDPRIVLEKNCLFNFCLAERGVGKTFNSKVYAIKHFLKTGKQFVYVRRYREELQTAVSTFWEDIINHDIFDENTALSRKKTNKIETFLCNGEVCGYAIPLSTSNILKSTAFPNVDLIIFDEFLIDVGNYRYLKNEVVKFLELYETIARTRDVQVLFLGNAISINNPYFNYFELDLPYNKEFKSFKNNTICVQYVKNLEYRELKKQTKFGQLISDTPYGSYAIDNQFLRDSNAFIENKGKNPKLFSVIEIDSQKYGIWYKKDNAHLVISKDHDPNIGVVFSLDMDSHQGDSFFANTKSDPIISMLINRFKRSQLGFDSQKVKGVCLSVLRRFMSY